MQDRPSVVSLRATLTAFAANPANSVDERALLQQVCDVVDDMRLLGWPPERVIIAVKEIASQAGLRSSGRVMSATAALDSAESVIAGLVRWCIERYYDDATPQ